MNEWISLVVRALKTGQNRTLRSKLKLKNDNTSDVKPYPFDFKNERLHYRTACGSYKLGDQIRFWLKIMWRV